MGFINHCWKVHPKFFVWALVRLLEPNTTVEWQKNHSPIFDSVLKEKRNLRNPRHCLEVKDPHFLQIALPQTQRYRIAFEGGMPCQSKNLPGKQHFTIIANYFDMARIPHSLLYRLMYSLTTIPDKTGHEIFFFLEEILSWASIYQHCKRAGGL